MIDGLYNGDCLELMKGIPTSSIDLIMTSPPYGDRRKSTYGGVKPEKYNEWFLPISEQMLRVLNPKGTFILNIKEQVTDGQRDTYVIELILALKKQGWLWTEEFIWHKTSSFPGKWPNRFRDSWERILQFNKEKKFSMYQNSVMIPASESLKRRMQNLSETDKIRNNSKNGSGFGKNISNWVGRDKVFPTNVLHLATECSNKNHSAAFPISLPTWFIKLFTKEGDLVIDCFMGSGTTGVACKNLNRRFIGMEMNTEYFNIASKRINGTQNMLFVY